MKTNSALAQEVCVKTFDLRIKAAGKDDDLADGEFIGYASAFGNVDSYGDIVEPQAFDRTLEEWKDSGDTIPVLWGHDVYDPFNNIGGLVDASPDEKGLKVHGFLDIAENPTAAQVYRLMKGRRTTKMSFAYSVRDSESKDDGNHLKDLDLFEVSVVQIPANMEAEIVTVKHALAPLLKAGRVLSRKNEAALVAARDAITEVLDSLGSTQDSDSEQSEDEKAASAADSTTTEASEPEGAKLSVRDEDPEGKSRASSEERQQDSSVEVWAEEFDLFAAAYGGSHERT